MRTLRVAGGRRLVRLLVSCAAAGVALFAAGDAVSPAQADEAVHRPPERTNERPLNPQPEPPGAAATAAAAGPRKADPWRRVVARRYSSGELDLAPDVPARRLALAAIARSSRALGLKSSAGVRFAFEAGPTGGSVAGGRPLRTLRFRQHAGDLRVLWSEIDVAVVDGRVTSMSATTVPFSRARLEGRRRVSGRRATAIAKRALRGSESALRAQPVAYAGTPGKPWTAPRRAWVVQLEPVRQGRGHDAAKTICVVVDAESGKVLMRYGGFVGQGNREVRGAPLANSAAANTFADIRDAQGGTGAGQLIARWNGDPHPGGATSIEPMVADWALRPGAYQAVFGINPFLSACRRRDFCVGHSIIHGFKVGAQMLIANSNPPSGSYYSTTHGYIVLEPEHADNDDVIAHELGHRRDFSWADERVNGHQEVDEVEEALADMFAYDFDFDPSMFEDFTVNYVGDELKTGNRRYLAQPSIYSRDGAPYPNTMSQYRCPDSTDEHINATILGHAYYLFAAKVGHEKAGNVLTYIPYAVPAAPSFNDVAYWFIQRSQEIYGSSVADAARQSFRVQAGIGTQQPAGPGCASAPPLNPPNPPSPLVCERQNPPPSCFHQSPPTRPDFETE